jgi:polyisoprenoid-binding protein YceI
MFKMTMYKIITAAAVLAISTLPAMAADTYKSDQGHTEVFFGWAHAGGVSIQHGEFTSTKATLMLDTGNVEASSLSVTIKTDSLSSGYGLLDDDLKSDSFLDVTNFPTITFESTSIKQTSDMTADVTGDLTIHGVTLPTTLKTTLTHQGQHPLGQYFDHYKGLWVAFHATTEIDHMAYGVGGFSTGPITIEINTELKGPQ